MQFDVFVVYRYSQGTLTLIHDCLSDTYCITTANESKNPLTSFICGACFKFKKWCPTDARLLADILPENPEIRLDLDDVVIQATKTLRIIGIPKIDELYENAPSSFTQPTTKHVGPTELACIFDNLGFCGPIAVSAKIFMQELLKQWPMLDEELLLQEQ